MIAHFLFATQATDPLLLAMAVAVLLVTAAVASWVPARRALRINPVEVLRVD